MSFFAVEAEAEDRTGWDYGGIQGREEFTSLQCLLELSTTQGSYFIQFGLETTLGKITGYNERDLDFRAPTTTTIQKWSKRIE